MITGVGAVINTAHVSPGQSVAVVGLGGVGLSSVSRDIPRYINLFQDGRLPVDRLMSRSLAFEELNEAFYRLADANTVREVLVL